MLSAGTVNATESKSMQLGSINHSREDEGPCKRLVYKSWWRGVVLCVGEAESMNHKTVFEMLCPHVLDICWKCYLPRPQ